MSHAQDLAPSPIRDSGVIVAGRLWHELAGSFRNPGFWALSSWLDILVRARRSYLGPLWLLMPAVVYVFGIGFFFAGIQGRTLAAFAAHVGLGSMIFRTLVSTLIGSAGIFNASQSFILDGHMRLTDYLLQSLARSFFDMLMFIPVTAVALAMHGQFEWTGVLLAIPTIVVIYINAIWISVAFALIGARYSDFGQLLSNITIFLFLLTPIIWYPEMAPPESVRGQLMRFNPFYHFVELFRAPILGIAVETTTYWYVGVMTAAGLAFATLLYRRYARFVPLWI